MELENRYLRGRGKVSVFLVFEVQLDKVVRFGMGSGITDSWDN